MIGWSGFRHQQDSQRAKGHHDPKKQKTSMRLSLRVFSISLHLDLLCRVFDYLYKPSQVRSDLLKKVALMIYTRLSQVRSGVVTCMRFHGHKWLLNLFGWFEQHWRNHWRLLTKVDDILSVFRLSSVLAVKMVYHSFWISWKISIWTIENLCFVSAIQLLWGAPLWREHPK